ncbi:MAG: hypothetical protein H0U85_02900, partial [Gemmatimonadales bacterium]|nr:hypothetical protein [Gemmatimonadales bacterium]
MLLAVALVARRKPDSALLAATAAVGAFAGMLARVSDGSACAARLPAGMLAVEVETVDPVLAAGLGRVAPRAGCGGSVTARWP